MHLRVLATSRCVGVAIKDVSECREAEASFQKRVQLEIVATNVPLGRLAFLRRGGPSFRRASLDASAAADTQCA